MGTADICQPVEETGITVDRLEMGDIIFLYPKGIRHMLTLAVEVEHKFVFRMRVTDREIKCADVDTFIQYGIPAVLPWSLVSRQREVPQHIWQWRPLH